MPQFRNAWLRRNWISLAKLYSFAASFVATVFLIDPIAFAQSVASTLPLVAGLIAILFLGKWIAATVGGSPLRLHACRE